MVADETPLPPADDPTAYCQTLLSVLACLVVGLTLVLIITIACLAVMCRPELGESLAIRRRRRRKKDRGHNIERSVRRRRTSDPIQFRRSCEHPRHGTGPKTSRYHVAEVEDDEDTPMTDVVVSRATTPSSHTSRYRVPFNSPSTPPWTGGDSVFQTYPHLTVLSSTGLKTSYYQRPL